MNFKKFLIIILFPFSPLLHGANSTDNHGKINIFDDNYTESSYFSNEVLEEGANLNERDDLTGLMKGIDTSSNDTARWNFSLRLNGDVLNSTDILGGEIQFSKKLELGGWLESFVSKDKVVFSEVGEYHAGMGTYSDDLLVSSDDLLSLGLGLGMRSSLIQYFIDSKIFFDTTSVFITYNSFDENYYATTYKGVGFRADYGIHRRSSSSTHYGLKVSYNLMSLRRGESTGVYTKDQDTLLLSWFGLIFDIGLYF